MQIIETPAAFRPPTPSQVRIMWGAGIEEAFDQFARQRQREIRTSWTYLPVLWMNMMWATPRKNGEPYRRNGALQRFLDTRLDPSVHYFTISAVDLLLQDLPPNITMFGTGGWGQIPLPMLPEPQPWLERPRELMASFKGTRQPGGPDPRYPGTDTWIPEGGGTPIRRRMWERLEHEPGFVIQEGSGNSNCDRRSYLELLHCSVYSLAPRGYGPATHRLYAAMQQGSIPVYVSDDPWLPYREQLDWDEFCVFCRLEQLDALPDRLRSEPEEVRERRRRRIAELVPDYFTLDGCCRQIQRYVETLGPVDA